MTSKRVIDKQRNAALTLTVSDGDDDSPIREFLTTSDNLYLIKEKGVYKVQLADDIDPKRTNPNIPNLSQRVLSAGYNDEVVARVLLTAKQLFDENCSPVKPFVSEMLQASLDLTKHILELRDMISSLTDEITRKEKELLERSSDASSFSLPSITDLNTKLHNIFIKADKAKDGILALYKLHFLPDSTQKPKMAEYDAAIEELQDIAPDLIANWNEIKKFFHLIRNIRNSSEHPKAGQRVLLSDFTMNADRSIDSPLTKVEHSETPIGYIPLVELLDFLQSTTTNYAEAALVFIRCAALLKNNPFNEWVSEFRIEERRHPLVKYYRSINMGGRNHILG